jgi:glycosyltransferase involved in cell wall biosynthesis
MIWRFANLVRAIDPDRFEVHVGYCGAGENESRFFESGMQLFRYAAHGYRVQSAASVGIVRRITSYIRRNRIQIVHTHIFNAHAWGLPAALLTGAKLLEHVHDYRYLESDDYKRRHGDVRQYRFARWFRGWSDRVVVLTRQNRDYLLRHHFYPEERIRVIRNGIPMEGAGRPAAPEGLRERLGLPERGLVILTSARAARRRISS